MISRRGFLSKVVRGAAGASAAPLLAQAANLRKRAQDKGYNVMFLSVDDLRPQLGGYGKQFMHTPCLDKLTDQAVTFGRHYVQVPTCGASRYALLTGQRPERSKPKTYTNRAFDLLPDKEEPRRPVAMPHHFRRRGYYTVNIGKVSHSPDGRNRGSSLGGDGGDGKLEVPFSWDEAYTPTGDWEEPWDAFFAYADGKSRIPGETPATEAADVRDTGYPDGLIAQEAVQTLQRLKDRRFFLAVGFYKPHLPFNAPKRYWKMYERASIQQAPYTSPPQNIDPAVSLHNSGELTPRYTGLKTPGVVTEKEARRLRHAYFACVSYVDAQIGKVLDALQRLGLAEKTVVVVWGDHGWHLGDYGIWGKHTPYERALRSPLIVRAPGVSAAGQTANGLVETLDIYPSLCELCGLTVPKHLDGESFVPMLKAPDRSGKKKAYGYWRRNGRWAKTIRTPRYRMIRWTDADGAVVQVELYDHRTDPHETHNVAGAYPQVVEQLLEKMALDNS